MTSFLLSFILVFLFINSAAASEESFCPEPKYVMRSAAPMPKGEELNLLTEEEKNDPKSAYRLSNTRGPYGHSELGYRFLARLFGYPGAFSSAREVEHWLEKRNARDHEYRGSTKIWEKWAKEERKRLRANSSSQFEDFKDDPAVLFSDDREMYSYSECVSRDLAELRCENHIGTTIKAGARVAFVSGNGRGPCAVYHNGLLSERPPASQERTTTYKSVKGDVQETTKQVVTNEGTYRQNGSKASTSAK